MKNLLITAVTVLAVGFPAAAQNWTQNNPTGGSTPSTPRTSVGMAYDLLSAKTVLYGGRTSSLGDQETWTFDGVSWVLEAPATSPPALWGHVMVGAPALGGVVLYGGRIGTAAQNQTWLWNGTTWSQIVTATTPPRRAFHQMAYDERRGVVVMHGGFALIPVPASARTWEFDGVDWREVTTPTQPDPVGDGRMVYDKSRGVCVMFGGWNGSLAAFNGTWEYDGFDWREVTLPVQPSGRQWHMLSYDETRSKTVLHGGFGGGASNDTWEYDGQQWIPQSPAGVPTDGPDGQMVYDLVRDVHVYYGGRGPTGSNLDTWEYSSSDQTASYAYAGSGCASTNGVPGLISAGGATPVAGMSFTVEVTNLSPTAAAASLLFGFNNAAAPLDLGLIGMPGCRLQTSTAFSGPLTISGSSAMSPALTLPSIVGLRFWNQAVVLDTGAGNGLGVILSDAARAYVGN